MRFAILVIAAAALLLPTALPVPAPFGGWQAFAAAADHPAKKKLRKHAHKKPKEKVEYLRAVPWQ